MKYIMTNLEKVARARQDVGTQDIVAVFQRYNRLGGQIKNENGEVMKNNYKEDIKGITEDNIYTEEVVVKKEEPKTVVKQAVGSKEVKKAK
jgi:hypothetical protein